MVEQLGTVFQIFAAIYITLSIDKLFTQFVTSFDVRSELERSIESNVIDIDNHRNEFERFIDELLNAYLRKYRKLAPIYLYFSIVLLILIAFDGLRNNHKFILDLLSVVIAAIGYITFAVFAIRSSICTYKNIWTFTKIISIVLLLLLLVIRVFFLPYLDAINYNQNIFRYAVSIFVLFSLALPIVYFVYYAWKYPLSCKELLEMHLKKNTLSDSNNLSKFLNGSESELDIPAGILSQSEKLGIDDVKQLLLKKGLSALISEKKKIKKECEKIRNAYNTLSTSIH